MSGSATENSILLSVLPRLNKIFNQSSIKTPILLLCYIGHFAKNSDKNGFPQTLLGVNFLEIGSTPK